MNKSDRLLAILLELQRRDVVRSNELATQFETSVRTIYRDIQALCEAGVPIIATPGTGYSLIDGYFLPPVSFTVEEAVTLLMGTDFIEQRFDENYRMKAQSAGKKIEAILPLNVRNETSRVRQSMHLLPSANPFTQTNERNNLEKVRHAILDKRKISFHYTKRHAVSDENRQSTRTAAPYGLGFVQGSWMLVAHCELRQDIRHFHLSRMTELIVLDDRFDLPDPFNLRDYSPPDDRHLRVHLRFDSSMTDRVMNAYTPYMEDIQEHQDGLHVFMRVRHQEELLQWVLSWGADVWILEPDSLRDRIRIEAEKILKHS